MTTHDSMSCPAKGAAIRCGIVQFASPRFWLLLLALAIGMQEAAHGRVVINEIFYNAPDGVEDLEYIELHNSGDQPVDLSGWRFSKGVEFQFPNGTRLPAKGFLVLCRSADRFSQFYEAAVAGVFLKALSNKGERLELTDAAGQVVDAARYKDEPPWPLGADGASGSLERICPDASGEDPANWISSPLSEDRNRPAGTPGKPNAGYAATLPPVIEKVTFVPTLPATNHPVAVAAVLRQGSEAREVRLIYQVLSAGGESPDATVPMTRDSSGKFTGAIPGQSAGRLIRFHIEAISTNGASRSFPALTEPRPALSYYVTGVVAAAKIPVALLVAPQATAAPASRRRPGGGRPGRGGGVSMSGSSTRPAFVYHDPESRKTEVFDFVEVRPRKGGMKVRFHKDQTLNGMTGINLIFEGEASVLAEPLAYEVYRRAGMAAPLSYHVRLFLNNEYAGYQLLVEQPNRGFLRRNKIQDDGNLYKLLWYEDGVAGQHEKKTRVHEGKSDIITLVRELEQTSGEAQWQVIRKNFDVPQVVNYFAVNTVLSHWDGFFNNYFTYHDDKGTGKWTMYPWDQDQTWGIVGMGMWGPIFYDMPITFGMNGDVPPGQTRGARPGRGFPFGGGPMWWRGPGWFSGPLLANPQFRAMFLTRTRQILETIYTESAFGPSIDAMGARLAPEVRLLAHHSRANPSEAASTLDQHLAALKEHLRKRREFLLNQPEIRNSGRTSPEVR